MCEVVSNTRVNLAEVERRKALDNLLGCRSEFEMMDIESKLTREALILIVPCSVTASGMLMVSSKVTIIGLIIPDRSVWSEDKRAATVSKSRNRPL